MDSEHDDCLTDVGFMFDSFHSRSTKEFVFDKFKLDIFCIDEDPGHVQSGQHLWPGASQLSLYCKRDFLVVNIICLCK